MKFPQIINSFHTGGTQKLVAYCFVENNEAEIEVNVLS